MPEDLRVRNKEDHGTGECENACFGSGPCRIPTTILRTGCVRGRHLVVLLQGTVTASEELFAFRLQGRTHGTTSYTLGFLYRHLVMAQPKLRSERVKFIRFRHGQLLVCLELVIED